MTDFVGKYVEDVRDTVIAALASRNHLMLVGAPGRGKTSMAVNVASRIFDGQAVMTRFNPTSGPEKVYGAFDVGEWLNNQKVAYITDETPYAPNCKVWIADEAVRANAALMDAFIEVLDVWDANRKTGGLTQSTGPITILTANFLPKGERIEAFLDRIGLNMWVEADDLDVREIVRAQAKARTTGLQVPGTLPTQSDIESVWGATPTDRAVEAVADLISLVVEMAQKGLQDDQGNVRAVFSDINPRRFNQWANLLIGTSILYSGTADFTTVHPKAISALRYAWVSKTVEEARAWSELVGLVADPVTAMIEQALTNAYDVFNRIKNEGGRPAEAIQKVSIAMTDAMDSLRKFVDSEEDPRYQEAATSLNVSFSEIVAELMNRK